MTKHNRRTCRNMRPHEYQIERVTEYPGVPPELINELIRARDLLFRFAKDIATEAYRTEEMRECMALDLDDAATGIDVYLALMKLARPRTSWLTYLYEE